MKLASLNSGGRDGTLIVVNRALTRAVIAKAVAPTLQAALDDWARAVPQLQRIFDALQEGGIEGAFDLRIDDLAAPLPRAYQWCDGSAYLSHAELVRKARGAEMPESLYSDPLMYQGGGDTMLGPRSDIPLADESWGLDLEGEIAVVTDDVPAGVSADDAVGHIKLVTILNDVSLRNLMPAELAKQFGFFQSKPPTTFAPVMVTPDELGEAWDGRKLHLELVCHVNGKLLGKPNGGADMNFDFAQLIAHAARTRPLGSGTIIGSGTVSNRDPAAGAACIQEVRMIEKIETGEFKTPHLAAGDTVHIDMFDAQNASIFGAIEQTVVAC